MIFHSRLLIIFVCISVCLLQFICYFFRSHFFSIKNKKMSETNGYVANGEPVGQQWLVGLLNSQCRYLTAESFGFKVNANGVGLKKKQLWTLEPFGSYDDSVCLRSHLDRYELVLKHLRVMLLVCIGNCNYKFLV